MEIKESTKQVKTFIGTCAVCKKLVEGSTMDQVRYNLNTHINSKHKTKGELNLSKESDASNSK